MKSDKAVTRTLSRSETSDAFWDSIVDNSTSSSFAHRWWLSEALKSWPGRSDSSFIVLGTCGSPIALVPLQLVEGRLFRILRRNNFESYGGILFTQEFELKKQIEVLQIVLMRLMDLLHEKRADFISLVIPFFTDQQQETNYLAAFEACGIDVIKSGTWVVDLRTTEEQLWQNLGGKQRNTIRKAQKLNITIRKASYFDLDIYYQLHLETSMRNGISAHPISYFENIWNHFFKQGEALILIAEKDGQVIAGQTFHCHKLVATYWTGASTAVARSTGVNSWLQWEGMKFFRDEGFYFFENGWKSDDQESKAGRISKFKSSFGGTVLPIYKVEIRNPQIAPRSRNALQVIVRKFRVRGFA
jgi:hypothetical protein